MTAPFADKIAMQNTLFSELSLMFSNEVPLYDKSLLANKVCNQTVCSLLSKIHVGFSISEEQLDKTSGERHGAIRIGKPSEYRWVARFFSAFALEPHNFYDMTNVGSKSQPIVATAFRSSLNPEHRVFCSLLMADYFDAATRERIETLLASREVFSEKAKELILKHERQNGLDWNDARELIKEATTRIFKWSGKARDFQLYQDLCQVGFKIAADIACFEYHHLNHLTPNTFCMDLYTGAMKFCLGEIDAATHLARSQAALDRLQQFADKDYMKLHFKHLSNEVIDSYGQGTLPSGATRELAGQFTRRLQESDLQLSKLSHAGFKDFTEGPSEDTPILLRQDAYKALTEQVIFQQPDGIDCGGLPYGAIWRNRTEILRHNAGWAGALRQMPGGGGGGEGQKSRTGQKGLRRLSERIRGMLRGISQEAFSAAGAEAGLRPIYSDSQRSCRQSGKNHSNHRPERINAARFCPCGRIAI